MAKSFRRIRVDGRSIELTHPDRPLFPRSRITKGDLADYYRRIAPVMLPHLRDRALTLQRFPGGIGAGGFWQREIPEGAPDWLRRVSLPRENGGRTVYAVAEDAASLVWLVERDCITFHPALARVDRPFEPDRMVFDLDPPDGDFAAVQRAARRLRELLVRLGASPFVKTTGSRGLHVTVPLERGPGFDEVRAFVRAICEHLAERHPRELTVELHRERRGGRVFLDYLRNSYGHSAVAPYAVRALEGAPVATPVVWREALARGTTARRWHLRNIFRRLARTPDPWRDLPHFACPLAAVRERFDHHIRKT